ncbi:MAG: hypothetical protein HY611_00265, partial [Elusimicrobia bacterium]|nr:hypothetical protein [Elusimicrobiota bacterium]
FLQQEALIYHQPLFQWLLARKPDRVVGLGFFVYDITGEAKVFDLLADWFESQNNPERSLKERQFARSLTRKDPLRRPAAQNP